MSGDGGPRGSEEPAVEDFALTELITVCLGIVRNRPCNRRKYRRMAEIGLPARLPSFRPLRRTTHPSTVAASRAQLLEFGNAVRRGLLRLWFR
jgi:hypothetical protein